MVSIDSFALKDIDFTKVDSGVVEWKSPSNIAIVKYWGKHGVQLPRNPSISFTLSNAYTETRIEFEPRVNNGNEFDVQFLFEGQSNEAFKKKIAKHFQTLMPYFPFLRHLRFTISSSNSFPHSSGIASSASSMSALTVALCDIERQLFGSLQDSRIFLQKASFTSRLCSGSACRSLYPNLALWGSTPHIEESSDLYAIPLEDIMHENFENYHDDILIVSKAEKSVSSTAGHRLMENNPYASPRYEQANQRLKSLYDILKSGDLDTFGEIAENEALTLHALMMCSNPSYMLVKPNTIEMIERIRSYRKSKNTPVFFSLDAGPNIHLLYPDSCKKEIEIFVKEELAELCEEGQIIRDIMGAGPKKIK